MSEIVSVYSQNSRSSPGLIHPLTALAREVYDRRWHIWISFKRDFNAAHAGTGFGKVWNFVLPLVPIMVYSMLAIVGFFASSRGGMDPAVFVSVGATFWFLLTASITSPMQAVQSNHKTIASTTYPLIGVVASSFGRTAFDFAVRITATFIIFAVVTKTAPIYALLALAAAIPAFIFFFAIGLSVSILNLIYADISRVLQMFLSYMIFVSNVIIPVDMVAAFAAISKYNPFAIFITNIRNVFVSGSLATTDAYIFVSGLGLLMLIIAARLFFVMEWRVRSHVL